MACYYIVISSTHLRDGQLRSIKGVFRGPIGASGQRNTEEGDSSFYCELCDKQYVRHQQYDNHINSHDHHHKQRLKELKQREFYRALSCRRQRRRREEKREERALRRLRKHEERRTGECAPGSGPMFRSTTVAVEPANQTKPEFVQDWDGVHCAGAALGTKPQTQLTRPSLPLDPALRSRLLSGAQWAFAPRDANETRMDCGGVTAGGAVAPDDSRFGKMPWARGYSSRPAAAADDTPTSVRSRLRPVSFSLPKRSCVLLHQSAAVFVQAARGGSGPPGRQEGAAAPERVKDPGEKGAADAEAGHSDTGNQCGADVEAAVRHPEPDANTSAERGAGGQRGTGTRDALPDRDVIRVEGSAISGNGAQLPLCNGNGTGAQVGGESGTGAHLDSKRGTPGRVSDSVSTNVAKDSASSRVDTHNTPEAEGQPCPATNQPERTTSVVLNEPKESSTQTHPKESISSKESPPLPPNRPKEPFCRVLSRDGARVLLWPSEMVSHTRTAPSVSFSINPLLYDFRAHHNRAKEGGEGKRGGPEEARERRKPPVIKRPECQQRQRVVQGGREVRTDEREEEDEGGQAGNPMELVTHCSSGDAAPDRCGCRDESALKFVPVSAECAPTNGLQKAGSGGGRRRRRRKRRGGVRRGARKRGRRKKGEEADRKEAGRRVTCGAPENQASEGRGDERSRREGAEKEERREKAPLSNLSAGGRGRRMRGEESGTRGDQAEREGAASSAERRAELLSNLPLNRCNRCDQLCLQVKKEARQQSAAGWGRGLTKLLRRGAACDSAISPVPGETPRCPAITPDPARGDGGAGEALRGTRAGGQEGRGDEGQRRPDQGDDPAPRREAARQLDICPVPTARDPAIGPAGFGETACGQRQAAAGKRRAGSPEGAPRRKRQRGRRQGRRTPCALRQAVGCVRGAAADPGDDGGLAEADGAETGTRLDTCGPRANATDELSEQCCAGEGGEASAGEGRRTECGAEGPFGDLPTCGAPGEDVKHDEALELRPEDRPDEPGEPAEGAPAHGEEAGTKAQGRVPHQSNPSDSIDCGTCGAIDPADAVAASGDAERERREAEERRVEEKTLKEKRVEWEKEWVRRKEREDRERRKEVDLEHLHAEKRPRFPRGPPAQCLPLHTPLLLPPSSSSSFSFRHTIIQHLSLLPPPSHLPLHSYPHLLPSFAPLTPPPPPIPPPLHPSFYSSSPIPFLDAPGPYPMATAFHPMQRHHHHPPLFAPPHPAVLPLQVLF